MCTETYTVAGLTCDHCSRAVSEEVSAVDGVSAVTVDVATATVTVTSERPLNADRVREAVEEAGCRVGS